MSVQAQKTRVASQRYSKYPELCAHLVAHSFLRAPHSGESTEGQLSTRVRPTIAECGGVYKCVRLSCTRSRVRGRAVSSTALWAIRSDTASGEREYPELVRAWSHIDFWGCPTGELVGCG